MNGNNINNKTIQNCLIISVRLMQLTNKTH
jgi:hypothetical protein